MAAPNDFDPQPVTFVFYPAGHPWTADSTGLLFVRPLMPRYKVVTGWKLQVGMVLDLDQKINLSEGFTLHVANYFPNMSELKEAPKTQKTDFVVYLLSKTVSVTSLGSDIYSVVWVLLEIFLPASWAYLIDDDDLLFFNFPASQTRVQIRVRRYQATYSFSDYSQTYTVAYVVKDPLFPYFAVYQGWVDCPLAAMSKLNAYGSPVNMRTIVVLDGESTRPIWSWANDLMYNISEECGRGMESKQERILFDYGMPIADPGGLYGEAFGLLSSLPGTHYSSNRAVDVMGQSLGIDALQELTGSTVTL